MTRGGPDPALVERSFNSGVVRLAGRLLGQDLLDRALDLVRPETLGALVRAQHDQFVLNRLFEGAWVELDPTFNYLIWFANAIVDATGRGMSDARVLHYSVGTRPWELRRGLDLTDPRLARACSRWLGAYGDLITQRSLAAAVIAACDQDGV